MSDYIRRDVVLEIINTVNDTGGFAGYADYCVLFDEIDTMPAADVQPVRHAKCERDNEGYERCSACNEHETNLRYFNFCPHCGAKLDVIYQDGKLRAIKVV